MPSFVLPEFYRPFPARVNAHLAEARGYSKAWAREMGMLDDRVWDESGFESADYALNISMRFPDAPPAELNLLTAWNVCLFYCDDYFDEIYKGDRDMAGGRVFVARLKMLKLHGLPIPPPENPVERGLVDLWARTVSTMPLTWRARFSKHTDGLFDAQLRELANVDADLVSDPIDYHDVRRLAYAHSLDLLEHAHGTEVPPDLYTSIPITTARNVFADALGYANDIVSFQREAEREGEDYNIVVSTMHALGCDLQQAVEIVNRLRTARLKRFEQSAADEVPALLDEYLLDPKTRYDIVRYIEGIKVAIGGSLEFQLKSSRYSTGEKPAEPVQARKPIGGPTGLGTSAARIAAGAV